MWIFLLVVVVAAALLWLIRFRLFLLYIRPRKKFEAYPAPPVPDYASSVSWAALPDRRDLADVTPAGVYNGQETADADCFFIHPTTFYSKKGWNASIEDLGANNILEHQILRNQASVFNGSCRVYAPRYRQATLWAFWEGKQNFERALNLAYEDVLRAFDYYMERLNKGRPIVLASHSQGGWHAMRLLQDRFESKPLLEQLVAAYLPGAPIPRDWFGKVFRGLRPGTTDKQTGCIVSWNTYAANGHPSVGGLRVFEKGEFRPVGDRKLLCVNPLTWAEDEEHAPAELNHGGAIFAAPHQAVAAIDFNVCNAQCVGGVLRIKPPGTMKYRWAVMPGRNYHVYDYNLFYMNVRENVKTRVDSYLIKKGLKAGAAK